MSKEVAKAATTAVADVSMFEGIPTGLESVTTKDLIIPRLTILQALSPQVNANKPEYIKDAKVGDFCDVGVGQIAKELVLVPVIFRKEFLRWGDRKSGKGLVNNYGTDDSILKQTTKDEKGRNVMNDGSGDYIAETYQFFCINLSMNNRYSFYPMASTNLKNARRWLTLLTQEELQGKNGKFTAPMFYRAWHVTSVPTSNSQGDWYAPKFEPAQPIMELFPDGSLLKAAKEFMEQAKSGLVRGDLGADDEAEGDSSKAAM
jgi:hypothetical protein